MLKDIVTTNGIDLGVAQTEAPRAGNVLSIQIGDLEYASSFGIDLKYFLESEFRIQTASFKSYCVQRLLEHKVNVVNVLETIERLFTTMTFEIGASENDGSLIV